MFKLVESFNKEVIKIDRPIGSIEDDTEFEWCIGAALEELDEFKDARQEGDFIKQIDSVMDLIYFGCGFLTRMGIPADASSEIFKHIHDCNMLKKKGKKKRDIEHDNDAIKPEGWVGPEEKIVEVLEKYRGR